MSTLPRLLCVDDEPELLNSLRLTLRKQFALTVAESGPAALALFDRAGEECPFDAVVSDMRMPGMTGAELLTELRRRHPEMPRLLLSGQSDLDSAIAAINDGKIFRFLTKPCPSDIIAESVAEALEQRRLRQVEKDLLEGTLSGTVSLLTELLGLVNTAAYSRTMRLSAVVTGVCRALRLPVRWDLGLAATLCQIGFVVVPENPREGSGTEVDPRHATIAADLVARIPRLESVADMIRRQTETVPIAPATDRSEWAEDDLYAEILRVSVAYDLLLASGQTANAALTRMAEGVPPPAPFLLQALSQVRSPWDAMVEYDAQVRDLAAGMRLRADVLACDGMKLASADTALSSALIERILAFADSRGVVEPIPVMVPMAWLGRRAR